MLERLRSLLWPPMATLETRSTQIHTATDFGRDILVNTPDGWEHDQRFMWWVDGPGGGGGNAFGNPPPGAENYFGADALPAVLRCTSLIADTLAGLPWNVYRGYTQLPTPPFITDPQLLRDDRRKRFGPVIPDAMSHVEFWTGWITSALWFGDAFAYSPFGADGNMALPLFLLDPLKMAFQRDGDRYFYAHSDIGEIDPRNLIRLRGEPPYQNGEMGKGVFDRFSSDMSLATAMRNYAANIFASGIPAGYLKVNNPQITETQADTLKARWLKQHSGKRSIAVLNAVTDFVPVAISPIDSQLDTAKVWSLRDIAMAFGIPAYMLGVPGDSSTYANVESRMTEFRTFTLLPWIRRIEATLDSQFPQGVEVKINTDGTLRADPSTRFASYESALRAGWLGVDEVRALEDRPPLPEQVSTAPEDTLPPAPEGVSDGAPVAEDDGGET